MFTKSTQQILAIENNDTVKMRRSPEKGRWESWKKGDHRSWLHSNRSGAHLPSSLHSVAHAQMPMLVTPSHATCEGRSCTPPVRRTEPSRAPHRRPVTEPGSGWGAPASEASPSPPALRHWGARLHRFSAALPSVPVLRSAGQGFEGPKNIRAFSVSSVNRFQETRDELKS